MSAQVSNLPVESDCSCTGAFSGSSGVNYNVNCSLAEPICIDPPDNQNCGPSPFIGQYNRRRRRGPPPTSTIVFDGEGFFGSDFADPPAITIVLTHVRPVDYENPLLFTSCEHLPKTLIVPRVKHAKMKNHLNLIVPISNIPL